MKTREERSSELKAKRLSNLEFFRSRERGYRKKNIREDNWVSRVYARIISPSGNRRRSGRNIEINLTRRHLQELWDYQEGKCYFTGVSMVKLPYSLFSVSADRLDSEKGYVPGNVVLVCQATNLAKNKHSEKSFCDWLNEVRRAA